MSPQRQIDQIRKYQLTGDRKVEMPEKAVVRITRGNRAEFVLMSAAQYDVLMSAINWIFNKTDTLIVGAEEFQRAVPVENEAPSTDEKDMSEMDVHLDPSDSENGAGGSYDFIHLKGCRIRLSELGEWQRAALADVLEAVSVEPTAFEMARLPKRAQRIVRAAYRFVMPMRGENWTYLARYRFDELQAAVRSAYGIKKPEKN